MSEPRKTSRGQPGGVPGGAAGSAPPLTGAPAARVDAVPRGGGAPGGPGRAATAPRATGGQGGPVKSQSMPRQNVPVAAGPRGGTNPGAPRKQPGPTASAQPPLGAPKAQPGGPVAAAPRGPVKGSRGPVPVQTGIAPRTALGTTLLQSPPQQIAAVTPQEDLFQDDPELQPEPESEESFGPLRTKFDKVAIAQRCLGIPIAEVVKNHHERLALLEEKVYGPGGEEEKIDLADQLNSTIDYTIQKKKRRGFFRRKKKVKDVAATEGEQNVEEYEDEFVEEDPAQDQISLEMMESQITREEVLRMFHAQSATFKDLLREQRRCYDNALMNVMNELLAALEESEAGINGDRLNDLEERVALAEVELEHVKAMQEASKVSSGGFFTLPSRKVKESDEEDKGSQSGSVFGIFGGGKPAHPPPETVQEEEKEDGFFSKVFGGKKELTPPPPKKERRQKNVDEHSEYSETGSEYSDYSVEEEPAQPDYYEMEEQPPQVVAGTVPVDNRGRRPRPSHLRQPPPGGPPPGGPPPGGPQPGGPRGGSRERGGNRKGRDRSKSGGRR